MRGKRASFFANAFSLLKQTLSEWLDDQAPQLGAALAYYTVFSLAPLVLLLLATVGFLFHDDPAGAWRKMTEQMSYFLDQSAIDVVQSVAQKASQPSKGLFATIVGIVLALLGASGVFGQLQNALNTIWGVKAKPGLGIGAFIRSRFLSFAMVAGVCFLLLVSLVIESLLKSFQRVCAGNVPGRHRHCSRRLFDLRFCHRCSLVCFDLQISARRENPMARCLDRRGDDDNIIYDRKMGARPLSGQRHSSVRLWRGQFVDYAPALDLLFLTDIALWR